MAISLINHVLAQSANANSGCTTASKDFSGANLIVAIQVNFTTLQTVSDNQGNTYSYLTSQTAGGVLVRIAYVLNPTVSSSHTVTSAAATAVYGSLAVAAFSGVDSYDTHQNGGTTLSATSLATGSSGTPSADGALIFCGAGDAWTGTLTVDASQTILDFSGLIGGAAFAVGSAYEIQGTATARNPTLSWDGGAARAEAVIGVFKAAAGGAAPESLLMLLGIT